MSSLVHFLVSFVRSVLYRRKKSHEVSTLEVEDPVIEQEQEEEHQEHQQDEQNPECEIKAHLLLRLLGGECYGAVNASSTTMDRELWGLFPEDLFPRVLASLPFISRMRLRAVCKEWCSLLSSPLCHNLSTRTGRFRPPPLVCAYRFIHGNWSSTKNHGVQQTNSAASLLSSKLARKFNCRELHLLFPGIRRSDCQGHPCRVDTLASPRDGGLCIELWKERRVHHSNHRRHRGVPTILEHFAFVMNPITDTVIPLPELQTEGDCYLGRNIGLVSTKVEQSLHVFQSNSLPKFDISSFYWTSWWLDVGFGLRQNTSWFTRLRQHPSPTDGYPEAVHVRDKSGDRNRIGIGIEELVSGRFRSVICDGVVYGVHYLPDGNGFNRLFTRMLDPAAAAQGSVWHEDVNVPKLDGVADRRFFLMDHRASQSIFYVGQSFNSKTGKLGHQLCRLHSDCTPSWWFWLRISVLPETLLEGLMMRPGTMNSVVLESAFMAGDFIVIVLGASEGRPRRLCFVAFHVYEEFWQVLFEDENSEELADFDGFFEVRPDLYFPRDLRGGLTL